MGCLLGLESFTMLISGLILKHNLNPAGMYLIYLQLQSKVLGLQ